MGFAQQVGEREAEVESGITKMDYFVVEQDQPVVMNQHILWAVVAMDERLIDRPGFGQQPDIEGRGFGHLGGGVLIIGFEPERFEKAAIGENGLDLLPALVADAVDGPKQPGELNNVI